jgi:hypothetical protein
MPFGSIIPLNKAASKIAKIAPGSLGLEDYVWRLYLGAHLELSQDYVHILVLGAIGRTQTKHVDFDLKRPAMHLVAVRLLPDWQMITLDEYFEALYCVATHSDFITDPMTLSDLPEPGSVQ